RRSFFRTTSIGGAPPGLLPSQRKLAGAFRNEGGKPQHIDAIAFARCMFRIADRENTHAVGSACADRLLLDGLGRMARRALSSEPVRYVTQRLRLHVRKNKSSAKGAFQRGPGQKRTAIARREFGNRKALEWSLLPIRRICRILERNASRREILRVPAPRGKIQFGRLANLR